MMATGSFAGISLFMGARKLGLQIAEALKADSIDLIPNNAAGLVTNLDELKNDTMLGQVVYLSMEDFLP